MIIRNQIIVRENDESKIYFRYNRQSEEDHGLDLFISIISGDFNYFFNRKVGFEYKFDGQFQNSNQIIEYVDFLYFVDLNTNRIFVKSLNGRNLKNFWPKKDQVLFMNNQNQMPVDDTWRDLSEELFESKTINEKQLENYKRFLK